MNWRMSVALLPVQLSRAVIQPQSHGVGFLHRNPPDFVNILLVLHTDAQNLIAVFQLGGVIILDDVHHVEEAVLGGLLPPEGQNLIGLLPHFRFQGTSQNFGVDAASLGDLEGFFGGGTLCVLLLLKKLALGIPDLIIHGPVAVNPVYMVVIMGYKFLVRTFLQTGHIPGDNFCPIVLHLGRQVPFLLVRWGFSRDQLPRHQ